MAISWWNGTIYTMEREMQTVEAVLTEDGIILGTGSKAEMEERFAGQIQEYVDLQGGVLFPGFVDSHIHLIGQGETFLKLQLGGLRSHVELLQALTEKATTTPKGTWIIGEGWNENEWEDVIPLTKEQLDLAAPDHPVMLRRVCRHVLVVNSAALLETSTDEHTVVPSGGVAGRTAEGSFNGVFKEQAQNLILDAMSEATDSYLETALTASIEDCWRQGITGCHTEDLSYYGSCTRTLQAFQSVIIDRKMKFRTQLLIHHLALEEWKEDGSRLVPESAFIEYGAMKLFADGSLGGRTALLSHPYADDPSTYGMAVHSDEELDELVNKARSYGLPVAAHAIGDRAAEKVLSVFAKYPCPVGKKDRLIHGQILRKELIEQMQRLPVIVDIQPSFVASDFPWVMERVGAREDLYLYAWKSLLHNRIPCAGGSDAPIETVSPFHGLYAAVTRTKPHDPSGVVYGPDQCLSMFEAISLYTTGSAYAGGHELDRGHIKEGYSADFTILERDPFLDQPKKILENSVKMTVVDETIVFESNFESNGEANK